MVLLQQSSIHHRGLIPTIKKLLSMKYIATVLLLKSVTQALSCYIYLSSILTNRRKIRSLINYGRLDFIITCFFANGFNIDFIPTKIKLSKS